MQFIEKRFQSIGIVPAFRYYMYKTKQNQKINLKTKMNTYKASENSIPMGLAVGIYSALINKQLTDEQRAQVVANGFEELERRYPNLSNAVTQQELENTELKLTAQIEITRKDIEQLRAKTEQDIALVRKDIEQLRAKTEHDIALVRKDIELLRQETKKDIADKTSTTIKWTIGLFVAQTSLLLTFFSLN